MARTATVCDPADLRQHHSEDTNMKSICLVLTLAGHLVPIDKPFPSANSCEMAGFSMTDGQIVKGFACLPKVMVDGLPVYDCGKYQPDQILIAPPRKCTFNVMDGSGLIRTVSAPCDASIPGALDAATPDRRPPIPKYQDRME